MSIDQLKDNVIEAAREVVAEAMKPWKEHDKNVMQAADIKLFQALNELDEGLEQACVGGCGEIGSCACGC